MSSSLHRLVGSTAAHCRRYAPLAWRNIPSSKPPANRFTLSVASKRFFFCICRGYAFHTPLLSSYEAEVALEQVEWQAVYPMDYYSSEGGKWSNYNSTNKQSAGHAAKASVNPIRARKEARAAAAAAKVKMEIAYAPEEEQ